MAGKRKKSIYEKYIKRLLDIVLSGLALILLSPVIAIVAFLVRVKLGSPVIFKQERPGLNEKIFKMYKFRSMTDERDENGDLLPDEDRLPPFGKKLRSTSLDELPELWNIFKGDMSIVGPRPQLVRDMVFMSAEHRQRHTVRPGLTGLAQISGRNNITWEEKLDFDLEYLKEISFQKDVKIIISTVVKVFRGTGVSTDGMETAEDYGDYLLRKNMITEEYYDRKQIEAKEMLI